MKLSAATLSLLQNYASINSNISVKAGSELSTRTVLNTVQARAKVEETFPKDFTIYDLNQVLALYSIAQDPEIDFHDNYLVIRSSNKSEVKYFYADPSLIHAPLEKLGNLKKVYSFTLGPRDIQNINKIGSVVSAKNISIIGDGKKVELRVHDPANKTSNSMTQELGSSSMKFSVIMPLESLKLMPDTYDCSIGWIKAKDGVTDVLVFYFESTTQKLSYLVAATSESKI